MNRVLVVLYSPFKYVVDVEIRTGTSMFRCDWVVSVRKAVAKKQKHEALGFRIHAVSCVVLDWVM